jgi:acyl carrier protein
MYGELARDFSLLEAGYMSQLIMMEAARMGGLGLCPIGDMKFDPIRPLFHLDDNDILLHSFLGGGISNGQADDWTSGQKSFMQKASPNGSPAANGDLAGDLRRFLAGKLPEPMVPATFIFLETLPLTSNGKVNRRALPTPETAQLEVKAAYAPPETDIEQTLTSIVQAVLEVGEIGIHHNFFDLGGNSVHIVQILNKARKTFQREIPITEIFRHPTISAMAAYLSQEPDEANDFRRGDERAQVRQAAASRRVARNRRRQNR